MICALITMALLSFNGCGQTDPESENNDVNIVNDKQSLNKRLTIEDRTLELSGVDNPGLVLASKKTFSLTLVASVAAPIIDGGTTQATDIAIKGNSIFVSYNHVGETYRGAVDAIDIHKSKEPELVSQIVFTSSDINAVAAKGSKVYFTGATSTSEVPAFVSSYEFNSDSFSTTGMKTSLASYAGTDVVVSDDTIFVTTGSKGGVFALDAKTLSILSESDAADARSVSIKDSTVAVLSGTPGIVRLFNTSLVSSGTDNPIGGATIEQSKSTIDLGNETALAAVNDGGTKFICRSDDKIVASIDAVKINNIDAEKTVTNAAYLNSGLLFTANGEAGVYAYHVTMGDKTSSNCNQRKVELLGKINFGENLSANHIYYHSNYLFVANGLGGLKIVSVENAPSDGDDNDHDDE
jgi:hypothetical protein